MIVVVMDHDVEERVCLICHGLPSHLWCRSACVCDEPLHGPIPGLTHSYGIRNSRALNMLRELRALILDR